MDGTDRFADAIQAELERGIAEGSDPFPKIASRICAEIVRLRGRVQILEEQNKLLHDALLFEQYEKKD